MPFLTVLHIEVVRRRTWSGLLSGISAAFRADFHCFRFLPSSPRRLGRSAQGKQGGGLIERVCRGKKSVFWSRREFRRARSAPPAAVRTEGIRTTMVSFVRSEEASWSNE